jgi:hypothetical protein
METYPRRFWISSRPKVHQYVSFQDKTSDHKQARRWAHSAANGLNILFDTATLQLPRCTYEKEKKRKENSESVNVVEIYSGL